MHCMGFAFMEIVCFWSIGSDTLCGEEKNVADFIIMQSVAFGQKSNLFSFYTNCMLMKPFFVPNRFSSE